MITLLLVGLAVISIALLVGMYREGESVPFLLTVFMIVFMWAVVGVLISLGGL